MAGETKLALSDKELSLVTDAEWILTKQSIIQKVFDLFAANITAININIAGKSFLPDNVKSSSPKIYKGENYLQLPYVIMDYPRCFDKENIFAVRTMFWWGNFFSITLHLSGTHKRFVKDFLSSQSEVADLYLGVNEDEWQHHFQDNNFIPYPNISKRTIASFNENNFIKLALKFPLEDWNRMEELLEEGYRKIGSLLSSPGDEKDL